jgi:GNAT superfamily N-acetyltransferase
MIYPATLEDITEILALCLVDGVFDEVPNFTNIKPDNNKITSTLSALIHTDKPLVFVYKIDNKIIGFIVGELYEHFVGHRLYATDYALYVAKKYRHKTIGYKLLNHFFSEAIKAGADEINTTMVMNNFNNTETMERLLKRNNFVLTSKTYTRILNE